MANIDLNQLARALKEISEKGVVSGTPTATYGHGPGGLFSYPGMSAQVFNAMVLPKLGLQSILPTQPSKDANPLYGIFTGVTATSGSEPTGVCDDPPTVGLAKLCTHSQVWARMSRQTKVFDLDRMGMWTNRGEFGDLTMAGGPWQHSNPNVPSVGKDMNAVLRDEVGKTLFEFAVAWARDFAGDIYNGNPANNTAGGGRTYFNGLDILINTGRRDAITGVACPAADSIVESFNGLDVGASTANQILFVRQLTSILRRLRYVAANTGLNPVNWVIVMRQGLFYELTSFWPCAYQTYRCSTGNAENSLNLDRRAMNEMTDSMRGNLDEMTGQYLLLDGQKYQVVLDDAITETVMPGSSYRSDIYIVPLSVLGGTKVTYLEHKNYDAPGMAMEAAQTFAPNGMYYTSDGGRFLWHKKLPNNFCVQLMAKTEPRLLLQTPHLAARFTTVQYTPFSHDRDWNTSGSFHVNGGKTYNDLPGSFYSPTSR